MASHRILNPRWQAIYVATAGQLNINETLSTGTASTIFCDYAREVVFSLANVTLVAARTIRIFPMFGDSSNDIPTRHLAPTGAPIIITFQDVGETAIIPVDGYWLTCMVGIDRVDAAAACAIAVAVKE